jgi:hypothetical protein
MMIEGGGSTVEIHVDMRLTKASIRSWDSPDTDDLEEMLDDEPRPKFIDKIFAIPGVESVWIYQHSVGVTKARMFKWKDMLMPILMVLKKELDPKGELVLDEANAKKMGIELSSPPTPLQLVRKSGSRAS